MIDGQPTGSGQRARVVRIIWFSLVWATVLYALMAFLVERTALHPRAVTLPMWLILKAPQIAVGAGILGLALAWFVGGMLGPQGGGSSSTDWRRIQTGTIV